MSAAKIGLLSLTALVFSSMVGSGVFSLPQNMAQVANGSALLVAWLITGVGIIFLALSLLHLTRQRPDLDGNDNDGCDRTESLERRHELVWWFRASRCR